MRAFYKPLLVALAILVLAPAAADAHGYRHGNGTSVFLGFNFYAPPAYPYYAPRYYYGPPPVVYAPAPVYAPAVIQEQPSLRLGPGVGQGCREYTAPANVAGRVVETYGIACPRPDGSWQIVN